MQTIFRLPWCTDQLAPKMQTGKAALESMRTSPVFETSMLNKLKRKRTDSPEPFAPVWIQPSKKQRSDSEIQQAQPGAALLPTKPDLEQIFTQTLCGAASRSTSVQQKPCLKLAPIGNATQTQVDSATRLHLDMDAKPSAPQFQDAALSKHEDLAMVGIQAGPVEDVLGLTPLQQVIENEFNLQILTKHNELRLIEQELAKCQVALEQLRRCEVRPYPGAEQPSAAISDGTGASIAPPHGYTRPSYQAPHGVTDGPYTRHYYRWLLSDAQIDPAPVQAGLPTDSGPFTGVRSTRGSGSARKSVQKSLTMPSRTTNPMHSLPNYPAPAPKDKNAPMVLRRSTDGQLVKLICNNCHRGNFSSIQGFLNHCRIAHKVDYKSHDAAAVDCGRVLDEQEAANLPLEAQPAPLVHKPSTSRSSSTTTTPFTSQHYVHPMNTANGARMPAVASKQRRIGSASKPKPVLTTMLVTEARYNASPLTPSSQAPRLSAHFAKYQLGGNLQQAIANAKQKVEMDVDEDVVSPDALDSASPSTPTTGSRFVPGSSRAGSLAPPTVVTRPPSRKGYREPAQRHRPSPLGTLPASVYAAQRQEHGEIPESPHDRSPNFSPHTADSNPGLVSDHEDDDHGSASEDEVPQATIAHSLSLRRGGCRENMDLDVAVDDEVDGQHGLVIRRNSMVTGDSRGLRTVGSPSRKLGAGNNA